MTAQDGDNTPPGDVTTAPTDIAQRVKDTWCSTNHRSIEELGPLTETKRDRNMIGVLVYVFRNDLGISIFNTAEALGLLPSDVMLLVRDTRTNLSTGRNSTMSALRELRMNAGIAHSEADTVPEKKPTEVGKKRRTVKRKPEDTAEAKLVAQQAKRAYKIIIAHEWKDLAKKMCELVHLPYERVFSTEKTENIADTRKVVLAIIYRFYDKEQKMTNLMTVFKVGKTSAHRAVHYIANVMRSEELGLCKTRVLRICTEFKLDAELLKKGSA